MNTASYNNYHRIKSFAIVAQFSAAVDGEKKQRYNKVTPGQQDQDPDINLV